MRASARLNLNSNTLATMNELRVRLQELVGNERIGSLQAAALHRASGLHAQ
jgi:hypothetical protein